MHAEPPGHRVLDHSVIQIVFHIYLPFLQTIETKLVPSLGQTLAHQCTSAVICSVKTRYFKEKRERDNVGWKGATKWNLFDLRESEYTTKLISPTCWRTSEIKGIQAIWKCTLFFHSSKLGLFGSPQLLFHWRIQNRALILAMIFRHFVQTFNWNQWNMEIKARVLIN